MNVTHSLNLIVNGKRSGYAMALSIHLKEV